MKYEKSRVGRVRRGQDKIKWCLVISFIIFYSLAFVLWFNKMNESAPVSKIETEIEPPDPVQVELTMSDKILMAAQSIQNLPYPPFILGNEFNGPKYFNASCAPFPNFHYLQFSNDYWQILTTSKATLSLYGAYLDTRQPEAARASLRILGLFDRFDPKVTLYCQIWFGDEAKPIFSKIVDYNYIWATRWDNFQLGNFHPYLFTCDLRQFDKVPTSVSIVEKPCDTAHNNLRVNYDRPLTREGFAVCVKGLDFPFEDLSVRLIEWIELLKILGVDQIFFYEFSVHPNVTKVLRYYQEKEIIQVTPLSLPGLYSNDPWLRNIFLKWEMAEKRKLEVIPYNDCLYRNLYRYDWITLLDIDEVIIPIKKMTWSELMEDEFGQKLKNYSSYTFRNAYFLDDMGKGQGVNDIPKYLHMLRHVHRAPNYTQPGFYVKCFHNPEKVMTLHNHLPLTCLNKNCTLFQFDPEDAQLQHYRKDCDLLLSDLCDDYRKQPKFDPIVWKFKDALMKETRKVMTSLGLIR